LFIPRAGVLRRRDAVQGLNNRLEFHGGILAQLKLIISSNLKALLFH
jgi:hypothetical protein